jgi:hypothetical protein
MAKSDDELHPTEREAEANFARFPKEVQDRIRAEGDAIGQRVIDHLNQVLIGVPGGQVRPEEANHASGVVALIGSRPVFFTAQHVIAKYRERRASDPRVVFQIGNVSFDPEPRLLFESERDDIVAMALNVSDQARVPGHTWIPTSWPPVAPNRGEFVAFAGFPVDYRVNEETGIVDLAAIGGIMKVASTTSTSVRCVMERERLIKTRGPHVPPPGTRLWGMSGGPVFRMVDGKPDLTAIVTDFGESFEVFMMTLLSAAELSP